MNIIYLLIGSIAFLFLAALVAFSLIYASEDVRAALLGVFAVASVTLYSNWQIKKREREARFFSEKRAAYIKFINLLFGMLKNPDQAKNQNKLKNIMMDFVKDIMIWGNGEMVQTYNEYRLNIENEKETDPHKTLFYMEKLLQAIRKDLGHDDSALESGQLIRLLLNREGQQDLIRKGK